MIYDIDDEISSSTSYLYSVDIDWLIFLLLLLITVWDPPLPSRDNDHTASQQLKISKPSQLHINSHEDFELLNDCIVNKLEKNAQVYLPNSVIVVLVWDYFTLQMGNKENSPYPNRTQPPSNPTGSD